MKMKKALAASLIAITAVGAGFAAEKSPVTQDNFKIGVVNPVEVYTSAPQGKASIEALQTKLKPKADELQSQQQGLMKQVQTLQTNAPTLTKSELEKQQIALNKDQESFKQKAVAFRQSEMAQEQEIAQAFQKSFNTAAERVAKAKGYSLILSSQAVAYAAPDLKVDVTNEVINKMSSGKKAKADKKA